MDFIVSGLVVNGQRMGYHNLVLVMEPDSTSREVDKKQLKTEIKREKNRESSARSRKRKKNEDEKNQEEIVRLRKENMYLRRAEERLMREGQEILEQVDPYFHTQPVCQGCAVKDSDGTDGPSSQPPVPLLIPDPLPDVSLEPTQPS